MNFVQRTFFLNLLQGLLIIFFDKFCLDLLVHGGIWYLSRRGRNKSLWCGHSFFIRRAWILSFWQAQNFTFRPRSHSVARISDHNIPARLLCDRIVWACKETSKRICKGKLLLNNQILIFLRDDKKGCLKIQKTPITKLTPRFPLSQIGALRLLRRDCARLRDC